jgi:hypothetical protein
VLPSLTKRLSIALYPSHVALTRHERHWRRWRHEVSSTNNFACSAVPGAPAWAGQIAALGQALDGAVGPAMHAEVTLSDHFVRYALIPWSDNVQSGVEIAALGRATMETLFGAQAALWEVRTDVGAYGVAGIACALDGALLAALHELCGAHRLRLSGVQPYLMKVFNHCRRRIGPDGMLAVLDTGRCVLASMKGGAWHSVRSLAAGTHADNAIDILVARERLLQGVDSALPLYVHARDAGQLSRLRQGGELVVLDMPAASSLDGEGM